MLAFIAALTDSGSDQGGELEATTELEGEEPAAPATTELEGEDQGELELAEPTNGDQIREAEAERHAELLLELEDYSGNGWAEDLAAIVADVDGHPIERFDAVNVIANAYRMDLAASIEAVHYLVGEYQSGRYLIGPGYHWDTDNPSVWSRPAGAAEEDGYALQNVLVARVLERSNRGSPVGEFAFDFHQIAGGLWRNTKHTEAGSDFVTANQDQIARAISEFGLAGVIDQTAFQRN